MMPVRVPPPHRGAEGEFGRAGLMMCEVPLVAASLTASLDRARVV